jgi:hypothetical protein
MKIKKRRAMQLSFAWIFAALIGAIILFLAVYISTKLIKTGELETDLKTGKEIGILLNPLETGFQSGQTTYITLPVETRIYGECVDYGNFGEQRIKISQLNFKTWTDTKTRVSFQNKYIFSGNYSEGKKFYIFSKPFEMPFKIADLVYLSSSKEKYCFIGAPEGIEKELNSLGQENIATQNCLADSINICFSEGGSCDINVNYERGIVTKNSDRLYFVGDALMYAAIFSDAEIYECQVKRLMKRTEQLSYLYIDKASLVSKKECNSNLNLVSLQTLARHLQSSSDLLSVSIIANEIEEENGYADCKLW